MFVSLLVLVHLIDAEKECTQLVAHMADQVTKVNRRALDPLASQVYFYYALVNGNRQEIRPQLLMALRTAVLRRDDACQAMLINLLLRNYLAQQLYDQADKLASKTQFPANASNKEVARHMFYLGRIRATMLEYTDARDYLLQAIGKTPSGTHLEKKLHHHHHHHSQQTSGTGAVGFLQQAYKWYVTVQLLLGEVPERALFRLPILRACMEPYFHVCVAVRHGDLAQFQLVATRYATRFQADGTHMLI